MPTTDVLPAAAAPPVCPTTAFAAVGCLLAATLAIGIAAIASPRHGVVRAASAAPSRVISIDATITGPDGAVLASPHFYAIAGEPATYTTSGDGDGGGRTELAVTATPSTNGDLVIDVREARTAGAAVARVSESARVHRGERATFVGADGTKIVIAPHLERRAK